MGTTGSGRTDLGMPAVPPPTGHPTWKQAWDTALYGANGYLRRHPVVLDRDRDLLVEFALERARACSAVVLLGAAGQLAPDLGARRPDLLLRPDLPEGFDGLVLAVDWLAHVPAHVVEVDPAGVPRLVHVDPVTGEEALGSAVADSGVPPTIPAWLERQWPLAGPGQRAEVGTSREAAWRDVVRRLGRGTAIAIEPGHLREVRPADGSLRSPRGRRAVPDGDRDLLADVALDAVVAAGGGEAVPDGDLTRVELEIRRA